MEKHSIPKVSEKKQVNGTQKTKLKVAVYCRVGSAEQLSDGSNMQIQKGGGHYNAKP